MGGVPAIRRFRRGLTVRRIDACRACGCRPASGAVKILIAEDDAISRKLLTTTLEQFGHEIEGFDNGGDAWQRFDNDPVRVVVSDWLMPKIEGLEFCRRVRARDKTEYTYFILLTANVQ